METKSVSEVLLENQSFQRLLKDRSGSAIVKFAGLSDLETKATLTSAGAGSSVTGVIPIGRIPQNIVPPARRALSIRDMLTVIPTTRGVVDFVKVSTDPVTSTAVNDASPKASNTTVLTASSADVATVSAYQTTSAQILEDVPGLSAFLQTSLAYGVRKEEDRQILKGTGADQEMYGLINLATAFTLSLAPASDGYGYADIIGRACQQLDTADEFPAKFVAVNPVMLWNMRLARGGGVYNFREMFRDWGLTMFGSTALSSTEFLVGSPSPIAVQLHERSELTVEISLNEGTNFQQNLVTIRAEERVALTVQRPASFITGTLTRSPA